MSDFLMPSLGADMEAGTLLEWYVKPGDAVKRGDIVALVDTSKAEIEVEIFEDGVIDELLVGEGARVPVGTVLATVRPVGVEAKPAVATAGQAQAEPVPVPEPVGAPAPMPPPTPTPVRAPVPGVRRPRRRTRPMETTGCASLRSPGATAEELGVDLSQVPGSGPNGAITPADVERVAARWPRRRSRRQRPARPPRLRRPTVRRRCARRSAR